MSRGVRGGLSSGQDHPGGAGIIEAYEQVTFPPLTRCEICHRTVTYRPGSLSEVLTERTLPAGPDARGQRQSPPSSVSRRSVRRARRRSDLRRAPFNTRGYGRGPLPAVLVERCSGQSQRSECCQLIEQVWPA
jgi:hypothetical protein